MTPPKKGFSALRQGAWWIKNVATKAMPRPTPRADTQRQEEIQRHARTNPKPGPKEPKT
jgi:hypothetical protein